MKPSHQKHTTPKLNQKRVLISSPFFREGTTTHERDQLFMIHNGGMGDFICWTSALIWVSKNYNFINGHIIAPGWFVPFLNNIFKDKKNWFVHADTIPEKFQDGYAIKRAPIHPINATMMHLVELGFLYYAGVSPVPEGAEKYPILDLENIHVGKDIIEELAGRDFIVMTPGATAQTRAMPAKHFNGIKEHIIKRGLTPVFLGTRTMEKGKRKISFDEGYDFSGGIDLVNRTTILQAAKIMSWAKCVVGIDNGLLHLAATTEVPIVFGYTIAGPAHRRPLRDSNKLVEVYCGRDELKCTFCQEKLRFFYDHDFENCVYKDNKCTELLTAESFNNAIDIILDGVTN